jgi:hypothetical protein
VLFVLDIFCYLYSTGGDVVVDRMPPMSASTGSWLTATGFAFTLFGVTGGGELLIDLLGVLVGANFIAAGVRRMDEDPTTPTSPAAPAVSGALTAFPRRNLAVVGITLSSAAVTAVSGGEAGPVLCFAMLALFLLGLCFINMAVVRSST